ncbi:hypothetical protein RvY_11716 [Ramazzottius varieornatus]|uniref:Uncharacterized protein n=1 Tax=Ramazzottius varieornatus TaxID=947166 RepID=A0A1D1VPS4_RAMVA|nr:hypothetical protein RvY_11716 [Ramazzottius varieornatus]
MAPPRHRKWEESASIAIVLLSYDDALPKYRHGLWVLIDPLPEHPHVQAWYQSVVKSSFFKLMPSGSE